MQRANEIKAFNYCLVLVMNVWSLSINAGTSTKVTTNCIGNYVSCENVKVVVMNQAIEEIAWKTALTPVRNLGQIKITKDFVLKARKGQYRHVVSGIPTKGKMAGKPIQIFLIAFNLAALPTNIPPTVEKELLKIKENSDNQSILLAYKQFGSGDAWIKIASQVSPKSIEETFGQINFTLTPEGEVTFYSMSAQGKLIPNVIDLTEQY